MLIIIRLFVLSVLFVMSTTAKAELPLPIASLIERQTLGNLAEITQHGSANSVWLEQLGQANVALLHQAGYFNQLELIQHGHGNQALISQFNQSNQVTIMQQGDFNLIQVEQHGNSGFSLQQIGHGAEVSIIQY
ncbi:curlin subunit CsgB [Alkalimonas collagenimarina]|uniref:Curlin subunit CsgB n=1 Tax=Alkalimonas collagenimarina TaxID=400390 RepID=A0ABT9H2Y7_9GAMM|nr:curlin subunit CsgB [Alkalimonas collagenimarina]MDP4537429.1 curlin subunit CsgB [Alkalimonas collagenimarina]